MRIDRRTLLVSAIAAGAMPKLASAQDEHPPWMILAGNNSGPLGRWGHALIVDPVFDRLLLVGGRDDQGTVRGDLWSFDLGSLAWTALDLSGPKSRAGSAAAISADGTGFYYFGGESDEAVFDDLWWFDFANGAWREIAPGTGSSPARRSGVKGAIDALGRFVITHGHDGDTLYDDTWAYDPAANTWVDLSPDPDLRPTARYDHDFLALPGYGLLVLTGGCSDGLGPCPQGDLWAFDIYGGWSDVTPLTSPTPRTGSVMAQLGGAIIQVGGMTDLGPESDVWRGYFDGGTIGWQELTLVNHGPMGIDRRWRHAMAASGGEYYVFGGDGVEGALSDLWQFSLDRFTESEHTVDPNSDFDDSDEFDE